MESCVIEITPAAAKYGNLNIRPCGKDFFPEDTFGGSTKEKQGSLITINAEGVPQPIKTDIPTDNKTGRPKWIFRKRNWVKGFIESNNLKPGKTIVITRISKKKYKITTNNNHTKLEDTKNTESKSTATSKPICRVKPKQGIRTKKKMLDIGFDKTCECTGNNINCLTAKEWLKCQVGVWQFSYEGRDMRNKKAHPATFPIALARKITDLFSHEGELVLDPFVGSGTTLIAAQDAGRNAVGFDLQNEYINLTKNRLEENSSMFENTKQIAISDDALNISHYLPNESTSLIFTSPPYANLLNRKRKNKSRRDRKNEQYGKIEQYSQDPRDLGTMSIEKYTKSMGDIFERLLPLLRPKGHCVINVPDMWWENKRITIHVSLIQELRERGYELRNIIIWDRTNLVNRIGIFGWPSNYITMGVTFEYLLDFWRPPKE
ncbi:MAG: hypothetical protein FVQ80_06075 [Planctomycetes bacterium]|nr:hypothetical protein [Planctomycetota bacterium]